MPLQIRSARAFFISRIIPTGWCRCAPNWLYYLVFDYSIYCYLLALIAITTLIPGIFLLCIFSLIGEYIFVFFLEYLSLSFDNYRLTSARKSLETKGFRVSLLWYTLDFTKHSRYFKSMIYETGFHSGKAPGMNRTSRKTTIRISARATCNR